MKCGYNSQIFKDKQYLEAAKHCADACWQRGLLRKGYGICHGAGGNAYTFLTMFKLTGDERYLYYAYKVSYMVLIQLTMGPLSFGSVDIKFFLAALLLCIMCCVCYVIVTGK